MWPGDYLHRLLHEPWSPQSQRIRLQIRHLVGITEPFNHFSFCIVWILQLQCSTFKSLNKLTEFILIYTHDIQDYAWNYLCWWWYNFIVWNVFTGWLRITRLYHIDKYRDRTLTIIIIIKKTLFKALVQIKILFSFFSSNTAWCAKKNTLIISGNLYHRLDGKSTNSLYKIWFGSETILLASQGFYYFLKWLTHYCRTPFQLIH